MSDASLVGAMHAMAGQLEAIRAAVTATLPVSGPLTNAQLRASDVPVVATGGATSANQATIITALGTLHTDLVATNALLTTLAADIATIKANAANLKPNGAVTGILATAV